MITYRVRVRGVSPLMTRNPASMLVGVGGSDEPKRAKIPTPEEEAEAGTYRDADGNLMLPSVAFRNALLTAAKGWKAKFGGKERAARTVLAHIKMADEFTALVCPDTGEPLREYEIDLRRIVNRGRGGFGMGGSVIRARPKMPKWEAVASFMVDEEIIPNPDALLPRILAEAGRTVGVGDFRLERTGWFGAFEVID